MSVKVKSHNIFIIDSNGEPMKHAETNIPRKLPGRLGRPLAASAGGVEAAPLGPQAGPNGPIDS